MTPHEAAHGVKPNISGLHEWGYHVCVHNTSGSKLDSHILEGCWMGLDTESKGHHVYWPTKHSVSVERLEGENITTEQDKDASVDNIFIKVDAPPQAIPQPPAIQPAIPHNPVPIPQQHDPIPPAKPQGRRSSRICKPAQYVHDLLHGKGSATGNTNKTLPKGIQIPNNVNEQNNNAEGHDWDL
ncbi:hypothetical protein SERLA73DRAFT_71824 [Serpula lacrymans var. lacrymans S7.3]|uniref:Retroviral polymerase SH3-like domain-containing protein n=1 Tax=Serpula lacrymans var. lacrymans (strain S7.3) TaxID=936435 RepID=F8PT27_SERL3|nr:hypothetical protein SERLA73DRAFT_71824 [Serpula lacrymans var. lacrymans S7.3]